MYGAALLKTIDETGVAVLTLTEGLEDSELLASRLTRGEVERQFKLLAMAASGLPETWRSQLPEVDWDGLQGCAITLDGPRGAELDEALAIAGNPDLITAIPATSPESLAAAQDELGDVLAVLVNLGRRSGIDAEAALRGANDKFRRRFGEVERLAAMREITLNTADFATLDGLWDEAKAAERAGELRG